MVAPDMDVAGPVHVNVGRLRAGGAATAVVAALAVVAGVLVTRGVLQRRGGCPLFRGPAARSGSLIHLEGGSRHVDQEAEGRCAAPPQVPGPAAGQGPRRRGPGEAVRRRPS